jgi:hypothetical protein
VDCVEDTGEGHVGGQFNTFSFNFLNVKEGSYPKFCAQRTDEGKGSLMLAMVSLRREGRSGFPWWVWPTYLAITKTRLKK